LEKRSTRRVVAIPAGAGKGLEQGRDDGAKLMVAKKERECNDD
jgi:hypothetical protein